MVKVFGSSLHGDGDAPLLLALVALLGQPLGHRGRRDANLCSDGLEVCAALVGADDLLELGSPKLLDSITQLQVMLLEGLGEPILDLSIRLTPMVNAHDSANLVDGQRFALLVVLTNHDVVVDDISVLGPREDSLVIRGANEVDALTAFQLIESIALNLVVDRNHFDGHSTA